MISRLRTGHMPIFWTARLKQIPLDTFPIRGGKGTAPRVGARQTGSRLALKPRNFRLRKPLEEIECDSVTMPRTKSDTVFLLASAAWPAFLVDGGGTIRHANQAAIELFGPKLETDSTMLSALWAEQTESSEQFLARCERSGPAVVPLKLLGKGAAVILFSTYIAAFNWEGEKRL